MIHSAVVSLLQLAVDAGAIPAGQTHAKQPREIPAFPALVARRREKYDRQTNESGDLLAATVSVDLVVVTGNDPAGDPDALSAEASDRLEAVEAAVTDGMRGGWVAGRSASYESLWGSRPVWVSTLPVAKRIAA